MTSPTPQPDTTAPTCCGEGGAETPDAGQPQVVACMLCPNAGPTRYWRTNRADGRKYVPVPPLSEVGDATG